MRLIAIAVFPFSVFFLIWAFDIDVEFTVSAYFAIFFVHYLLYASFANLDDVLR